jgi:hypothetical protein
MNNHNPNNNMNKNASQAFVERWCDLQGVDWYLPAPKPGNNEVHLFYRRQMSGTEQLASWLLQHSQIVAPPPAAPVVQFFYERNFRRYVTAQERTQVRTERMYARDFSVTPEKNP